MLIPDVVGTPTKLTDLDIRVLSAIHKILDKRFPEPKITEATSPEDLTKLKYQAGQRSVVLEFSGAMNILESRQGNKDGRNT